MTARLALAFSLALLVSAPLAAQGEEQQPQEVSISDPEIAKNHLRYLVEPKTTEELEPVAQTWTDLLAAKAEQIASARVEGAEQAEINALVAEREQIVERLWIVLESLEAKGADVEARRKYVAAVSGLAIDLDMADGDVVGIGTNLWVLARDWVLSPEGGIRLGLNILKFILTLVAFKILASVLGGITGRALKTFRQGSELLRDFLVNSVRKITFFVGLVIALSFIGVPTGPFLAAIGAAGFVIGFALQGTLSNFAAGVMILLYRPYDIGNFVDVGGVTGTVKQMSLVSTTLTTPDNQIVIVPNSKIWGDVITNVTGNPTRRVDLVFGIGYGDDIGTAVAVLERLVGEDERVLKDPKPNIQVNSLGDSSVNLICRPWTGTSDYWGFYWDMQRKVKEEFDKAGVSIPFPQRDVHLHQIPAPAAT